MELLTRVRGCPFKGGQGAKTGTGGHLPGNKNKGKISQVREIPEGQSAISPPTFKNLVTANDFKKFANRVREISGGIPIGFKLAQITSKRTYNSLSTQVRTISFSMGEVAARVLRRKCLETTLVYRPFQP